MLVDCPSRLAGYPGEGSSDGRLGALLWKDNPDPDNPKSSRIFSDQLHLLIQRPTYAKFMHLLREKLMTSVDMLKFLTQKLKSQSLNEVQQIHQDKVRPLSKSR
jgi:hypothetical protein